MGIPNRFSQISFRSKWVSWWNTTTHHDLHHSAGNYNYGLYFTWWDRMMGTEHPEYKERFRAVAKPIRKMPRPYAAQSVAEARQADAPL